MSRTKLLVCCHANRWRSPLAAAFLARNSHLDIKQAGFLPSGHRAGKPVRETARELGFDLEGHRSVQISQELVGWADLVVVMNPTQVAKVEEQFTFKKGVRIGGGPSVAQGRAVLLGSYLEHLVASIPDLAFINPSSAEWDLVVSMIGDASRSLAECLKPKELGPTQFRR